MFIFGAMCYAAGTPSPKDSPKRHVGGMVPSLNLPTSPGVNAFARPSVLGSENIDQAGILIGCWM